MKQKCINFDWVQVWTYEPTWLSSADNYRDAGFVVKERSYGTRIFEEVITLIDTHGIPFVEICRNPKSKKSNGGILPDRACSIRLVNQQCYTPNALQELLSFLRDFGFEYKNGRLCGIQRLDIAMDFTHFDALEDRPQQFVNDYMAGKYSKVTQPQVRAVGIDGYTWKRYNSLSWGSTSSMVSTKMYCKTQEMAEVREKPWIRQAWVDSGVLESSLDETPVWRIEFKLTSECHEWIDEDGVVIHNTLEAWSSEANLISFYRGLIAKYFDFRHVDPTKSKYKAEPVDLWRWPKGVQRAMPRRKEHFRDTGRAEIILMNQLDRLRDGATTQSELTSISEVKQMVYGLYASKKLNTPLPASTPDQSVQKTLEVIRCLRDTSNMAQEEALNTTESMIVQMWEQLKAAIERECLWKSLFPSSRTGVQLSDFMDEYSAKGWFVTECNRLVFKWLQQSQINGSPLPLLAIFRELYPQGKVREIEIRHLREVYARNEPDEQQ